VFQEPVAAVVARNRARPADVRVAALAAVAPRLERTEAAVFDFVVKQLDRDAAALARLAAAEVLGTFGPAARQAVDSLRKALQSSDANVQKAAGEALLNILRPVRK